MRELFDLVFLALLQGVAEFLPISSSGHLVIAQKLLGMHQPGILIEVTLHAGTLLSVIVFYRMRIWELVTGVLTGCRESWQTALQIVISAIPAILFYFVFKSQVDAAFESTHAVGMALIFTGSVLLAVRWSRRQEGAVTILRALIIGLAQAIAILPGVSRSGMTISAARISGVAAEKAAEFSFLMSLPLIAGATVKEFLEAGASSASTTPDGVPLHMLVIGASVAAVAGYFALTALVRLLRSGYFWCLGIYCLFAGTLTWLFL